jgi:hypothetical protein
MGKIKEYRAILRQSLDLFGVSGMDHLPPHEPTNWLLELQLKSTITIQDHIAQIVIQQEELVWTVRKQEREKREQELLAQSEQRQNEEPSFVENLALPATSSETSASHHTAPTVVRPTQESEFLDIYSLFPSLQSSGGHFRVTSVGGNQNSVNSSWHVANTNSGNTTTTITVGSNNDSSVQIFGRTYCFTSSRLFNLKLL